MNRLVVILAVVTTLCVGVALGFMGGVMLSRHLLAGGPFPMERGFGRHFPRMFRLGPRRPGMPSPEAATARLQRLLDLTPAQADAIRGEIERTRGEFSQVRDSLHARIERHLTPAQRERWQRFERERRPDGPDDRDHRWSNPEPGREGDHLR